MKASPEQLNSGVDQGLNEPRAGEAATQLSSEPGGYTDAELQSGRNPNFFLLGAPKCGTTALAAYLKEHPSVYFSSPKEPDYWSFDMVRPERSIPIGSQAAYLQLFHGARTVHKAIGEGSTSYCYSHAAIPRILELSPDARFIVMVRNPIDLARSFHKQMVWSFWDPEPDFERAWRSQTDANYERLQRMSEADPVPHALWRRHYRFVGSLGTQLERIEQQVPAGSLLTLVFDDLQANPREVYLKVLAHLGIEDDGRTDFPRVNVSKAHEHPRLARLLIDPPRWLVRARNTMCGMRTYGMLHALRDRLLESISVNSKAATISAAFRAELVEAFAPEVALLERLLQRDLSHWLK
jgi:hypothetical protein